MAKNEGDLGDGSEQPVERNPPSEPANAETKRPGRPPARPPYEQYLRVSKVLK